MQCIFVHVCVYMLVHVWVYRPSSPLERGKIQVSMYVCILVGYMHCVEGKMAMSYLPASHFETNTGSSSSSGSELMDDSVCI